MDLLPEIDTINTRLYNRNRVSIIFFLAFII